MSDLLKVNPKTPVVDANGFVERSWFRLFEALAKRAMFLFGKSQITVGGAGVAAAPPATPELYQTVLVDGVEYVIPLYKKT